MTKPLVQGQIGYWENGKLVHMPKKLNNNSDSRISDRFLTPTKRQVLELLSRGYTSKEIAKARRKSSSISIRSSSSSNAEDDGGISAVGVGWIISQLHGKTSNKTRTELL